MKERSKTRSYIVRYKELTEGQQLVNSEKKFYYLHDARIFGNIQRRLGRFIQLVNANGTILCL